jgi:hypothetical protein
MHIANSTCIIFEKRVHFFQLLNFGSNHYYKATNQNRNSVLGIMQSHII